MLTFINKLTGTVNMFFAAFDGMIKISSLFSPN